MKHKHYDCIVAWANGEVVEYFSESINQWRITRKPVWDQNSQYRVKKESVVTVKYFQNSYIRTHDFAVPAYIEFTPNLEKWDLKITYHDDVAVKVELPS